MSRQRIVENINLSPDSYFRQKEDLDESIVTFSESGSISAYKALAVYTFPISRPDQRNLNNRIYTSQLWENVIRSGRAEGAYGLMDHPSNEGSVKDIWCVWRNLRFSKDRRLILCDAYLFGDNGRKVLEALEAGGRVGLSSSGWGEFLDDNTTLDPNSYELERPADFVLNPSYEVFGVQDDLVEAIQSEKNNETTLEVSPKESIKENIMDNNIAVIKPSPSLEEKTFELNMRSMFKEAKKIEDVPERIRESKSLLVYFEGHDSSIKQEIEEAIAADEKTILDAYRKYSELQSQVESLKEQAGKSKDLETLVESLNQTIANLNDQVKENSCLKEEFENACTLLDSLKEYTEKQEEMLKLAKAEANVKVSVADYKEALSYSEQLEEDKKDLQKKVRELRYKLKSLIEASKKNEDDDEDEDEEKDDEDKEPKEKDKDSKASDSGEKEDDDDDEEEDDEKEESYSYRRGRLNQAVVDYYEDLEYRNPKVVKIKEEILSKNTLLEAQKTYLKLRSLVEESDTKLYHSGKKTYVESTKKASKPLHEGWV